SLLLPRGRCRRAGDPGRALMRWLALALLFVATAGQAAPALNPLFSDHGVLQRGRPIPVWGTAAPGEQVRVPLGSPTASAAAPRRTATTPQSIIPGLAWQAVTPATVGDFSAACYYMVRQLRASEHVPIGAIADSWGGTQIRSWMDEASVIAIGDEDSRLFALA